MLSRKPVSGSLNLRNTAFKKRIIRSFALPPKPHMKLNPQQQEAVHYLDGPLFVLAGAGSGKTRVITEKIAYMITQAGYAPQHIAAITFTNKAAKEMKERVGKMLDKRQTAGLTVCTFHSLGMRILREESAHLGFKPNFSILDSTDCQKIITELAATTNRELIYTLQHQISLWKNALISPDETVSLAETPLEQQCTAVYAAYQETLRHYHAVDFDDLIRLPTELLQNNETLRLKWQQRIRYLLIDECQDTNACQYALLRALTGEKGMFTAVGDDDQSIYAWRGADMENLRQLQQDYPNIKTIKLEQNYRSTERILRVANQVITHNPKLFPKSLWSTLGEGDPIRVIACQNDQSEADWVAHEIKRHTHIMETAKFSDFAILYRSNHQARLFEQALRLARIPYQISGGQSFFDKAEIKDALAYIRLTANTSDDPAFLRAATTPKRGIGDTTLGKLNQYAHTHNLSLYEAAQSMDFLAELTTAARAALMQFISQMNHHRGLAETLPPDQWLSELLEDIDYLKHLTDTEEGKGAEIKWRNIQDFIDWLAQKDRDQGKNIIQIAQTIALMSLLEGREDQESETVKMSTLHAAKGLEYKNVFLVGCEEGLFPHNESIESGNIEEERRLMYVGITRAKQRLTLTHCIKRKKQGQWQFPEPSRFIDEMPQKDLQILGRKNSAPIVSKEEAKQQLGALKAMLNKKMG